MFVIYCCYLTALLHTNNIAGSACEDTRNRIALMIFIKDENRQINFYPWDYAIFLNYFSKLIQY